MGLSQQYRKRNVQFLHIPFSVVAFFATTEATDETLSLVLVARVAAP
jgi:hypothetical protein